MCAFSMFYNFETKNIETNNMGNRFLTEKLPKVNTCPSMRRTAVWLLPAVTCTLGPGRACTKVGEPLVKVKISRLVFVVSGGKC